MAGPTLPVLRRGAARRRTRGRGRLCTAEARDRPAPPARSLLVLDLAGPGPGAVSPTPWGSRPFEAAPARAAAAASSCTASAAGGAPRRGRGSAPGRPAWRSAVVPEAEAPRARAPLVVRGGYEASAACPPRRRGLGARCDAGTTCSWSCAGPISPRVPAARGRSGGVRTATLEAGYRIHLHRRDDPRPARAGPGAFDVRPRGAPRRLVAADALRLGARSSRPARPSTTASGG